jgi:MFS family permease
VGGLVVAAFAPSVAQLVPALFVAGVGAAVVPIASMGAVFTTFDASRRAWALGVRQMGVPVGGIVGALSLPALESAGGVRLALLFCAGAAAAFGLVFVVYGAGLVAATPQRHPVGAGLLRIVRSPGMGRLLAVAVFYIVVLQAVLSYLVPSVRDAGLSPLWSTIVFFVMQVGAAVSRVVWGRRADLDGGRRRTRTLVEAGWAAALGGSMLAGLLYAGPGPVLVAVLVFALGAMGWNALVYVTAGERAPAGLTAQSVAIAATVVFTTAAVTSPLMGAIASALGWFGFWALCAGIAVVGATVARGLSDDSAPTEAHAR